MAFGSLKVLPSQLVILLLILLYAKDLVAIVDHTQPELQDVLTKETRDEKGDSFNFDSLSTSLSADNEGLNVISNLASSVPIKFDPPQMHFMDQAIGIAGIRQITIDNPTHSLTLQLISISGSQPDFHSSFFVSKVLRPGESTTFEIVFLPRVPGIVQDTLIIQSSFGTYKYKISGNGIHNMFRLRPLRGARIPINATYSPSISFYNPFDSSLQIIEVYSSGGSLHLELPHGFTQGNKSVWEIRPYETKQIAKASFVGQYISNQTAFIRIKTSHSSNPSILIPVEVEVSEASGLFLSRELLDFGMIKSGGQVKLPLYILNAGPHSVDIKSITPVPDNPCIKVEYTNTTLKPSTKYTKVAILIFTVEQYPPLYDLEDSGMVKIWAEDRTSFHQLTVPYEAHILQGALDYEPEDTLFRAHDPPFSPIIRSISLINRFTSPIVIYSARLSAKAQDIFTVDEFQTPFILNPDGEWHDKIILRFHPHSSECLMNTTLRLSTNASFFNIPLQCYDGSLEHDFGGKEVDALEFGLMSERDSLSKVFSITNSNPVLISVTSIQVNENSNLPYLAVHLRSLPPQPKNHDILPNGSKKGRRPPYYISPGHQMVFSVDVSHPKRPGKFSGEILIYSSLGKMVTVPVNYQAVSGGIQIIPNNIKFNSALPYSSSSVTINIRSTYTKPIRLLSLSLLPANTQHQPLPLSLPSSLPIINPSTTTAVGEVILDPLMYNNDFNKSCELTDLDCSSNGCKLTDDIHHFISLWELWVSLIDNGMKLFQFSLVIDTEVDKNTTVQGAGSIKWPRLVQSSSTIIEFPLTLVGNTSVMSINIHNPSNRHLHIELMFLNDVMDVEYILQTFSNTYGIDSIQYTNTTTIEQVYSITTDHSRYSYDRITSYKKFPKLILPPHANQSIKMEFKPVTDHPVNGLLLLRNNITIFDYIELKGLGSRGFITVGGVYPGGPRPLLFEYTQSMMEECTATVDQCECDISGNDPSYSKTFIVRNTGPVPVVLSSSLGNNELCEDQGFFINTCGKPFTVHPNRTRRIELICTPDYTLSRITSSLRLTTPTGLQMTFPVLATLPHNMLVTCYSSQPRSELESLASYVSVPLWLLALLVMIIATVFQVDWHTKRLRQTLSTVSAPSGKDVPIQATGGAVFDLSNIAMRMSSTISNKMTELSKSIQTPKVLVETITPLDSTMAEHNNNSSCHDLSSHEPDGGTLTSSNTSTEGSHDVSSVTMATNNQQYTQDNNSIDPVETTPIPQPPSTPTKKSKMKRMCMKVEKSQNISSSSSSSTVSEDTEQSAVTTAIVNLVKTEQLSRKESDDSIAESDQDGVSSNGSEQSSVTPDPEESSHMLHKNTDKCPSFTKEPGTGQTVLVKEGAIEEGDINGIVDRPNKHSSSNVVSVSVNVSKQQRNRNKKQRAQQKREEKVKKKRKEKEDMKRTIEPFETFDKISISSSTNSTDNLEEDNHSSLTNEQPPMQEESTKSTVDNNKPVIDNNKPVNDSCLVNKEKIQPIIEHSSQCLPSEGIPSAIIDGVPLHEEEESILPEMETSCSSIEFRTPGLSPSPDDLTIITKTDESSKLAKGKNKEEFISVDTFVLAPECKVSTTTKNSVKMNSHPSSPDNKPKTTSSLPSTPAKIKRPTKLVLPEVTEGDNMSSSTLSSVETDGIKEKMKGRLAPHELAASLLKKIPLSQKQKHGSSSSISSSNNNQDKDLEDVNDNVMVLFQSTNSRKKSNEHRSSDHSRDKRQTPLSSDATPFFPHPGHHYSHPHNILPAMAQPFPPNRAPLPPPSYPHHYLPNSPYEYPMMRPMAAMYLPHDEQIHQFERKQRKRSDQKYKAFSPPNHLDPHYHDRPHPFPIHNYDSSNEWMDSHSPPIGYSDEDPFSFSYPVRHRRGGYPCEDNGPSYGFGGDVPPSVGPRSLDGPESIWDPNQLTPDEILCLKELRRQRLKKIIEKHHLGNNDSYEQLPAHHVNNSSEPFSLASLRERDMDSSTQLFSRSNASSYSKIEFDPILNNRTSSSFRSQDREAPLSWASPQDSLNRAPGPPGSYQSEPLGHNKPSPLASDQQLSFLNDDHSLQEWRGNYDESNKKLNSSNSRTDDMNGAWHSLWTMQTPLLSALEEQRQKTVEPPRPSSSDPVDNKTSYDLFEQSTRSIWSLSEDDPPFPWIRKTSRN